MKITKEEVLHVGRLARLELDDAKVEIFSEQIAGILAYIDNLRNIPTEGIIPTSHAVYRSNAFREDEERPSLDPSASLENAPQKEEDCFLVPRIIG